MESSDERYLSRQESTVNLDTATDMSAADLPDLSLLSELGLLADDIDITNFDLDLDLSPYDDAGDSVSDDSALGTSPQHVCSYIVTFVISYLVAAERVPFLCPLYIYLKCLSTSI